MYGSFANADLDDDGLIGVADALNRHIAAAQVALFGVIAEVDRRGAWRDSGARDLAHWLSIRYGMSWWKADRVIKSASALHDLPRIAAAFETGMLGIDKVIELTRFATPQTEGELVEWARRHVCHDPAARDQSGRHDEMASSADRSLRYWYEDGGRRFGLRPACRRRKARWAKALQRRRQIQSPAGRRGL
jgi:hypothetical protein